MGNESKDKYKKKLGYSKSEAELRSLELRQLLFDEYETRKHALVFQQHERFSPQFDRYHQPWPTNIKELGDKKPFLTVRIVPNSNVIETTLNLSYLNSTEHKDLVAPMIVAASRSLDESFMRMIGGNPNGRRDALDRAGNSSLDEEPIKKRVRLKSGKKSKVKKVSKPNVKK